MDEDHQAGHHAADGVIETTAVNHIPVVCETIPFFKSVSFGIWIFTGSRDEPDEKSGLFHFLEHLVFKGTASRDAGAIAVEIDNLGGHIDAFTSREVTCYSGHVVSGRLERAFDLVADITLNSNFPEEEVERERRVILEEIRSIEDNPSEFIHDRLYPTRWGGHPLGRLITGTAETVMSLTKDDLLALREKFYSPPRIVITACGDIKIKRLEELVAKYFGQLKVNEFERKLEKPARKNGLNVIYKPLEQVHLLIAAEGLPVRHSNRHELLLLNIILGGGVSSRLFQTVRERQGLAYSIYSFFDQYLEAGLFGVYAATSVQALKPLWDTVLAELEKICENLIDSAELERTKTLISDNLKMSFESLGARLSQIAHQKLYWGKIFTLEEMLENVHAVSAEGIKKLAEELLSGHNYTVLALGPVDEEEVRFMKS